MVLTWQLPLPTPSVEPYCVKLAVYTGPMPPEPLAGDVGAAALAEEEVVVLMALEEEAVVFTALVLSVVG